MREETTLSSDIKQMQDELRELKNAQRIGRDSIIGYRTISSSTYDHYYHFASLEEAKNYKLTFTLQTSRVGAIVKLHTFWSTTNPDVLNYYIPPWANGADALVTTQKIAPQQNDKVEWYVGILNTDFSLGPTEVWVKFIFEGTDRGSFNLVAI